MNPIRNFAYAAVFGLSLALAGCSGGDESATVLKPSQGRDVPRFSADSAFSFVAKQVAFGPRVPNTDGHAQALAWKIALLKSYAGERMVYPQQFTVPGYDGDTLALTNVIAAFNPAAHDRILLCAHWDTRPRSDADPDTSQHREPVLGADDGGSGVAVLLELARIFRDNPPPIGVDIVLFDGEDYGREGDLANYFLGSRFWSQNQPVAGYKPRFGILLDMVGGRGAKFPKEVNSLSVAPMLVNELWELGIDLGYDAYFIDETGIPIQDDHVVMNQYLPFRTIDIIHHMRPFGNTSGFPDYWHTGRDNLDIIAPQTLEAVGQTLLEMIYDRL